ncbi:MAG TPA: GNAT family N-acetyltransferase [Casimicrobiaceae bacterium]|nr:GNAT family N-acetyltransferase [Casimicrobiaceae bacterium]
MRSLPAGLALRAATAADSTATTAIYAHHVRTGTATFEIEPPDAGEMKRRWREVTARGLPYLVATREGEVIGYAYAGPYRPRPAYRFAVEDSIYVRADACGKGIGRALLAELIAASERAGARQMIAVIGDAANAASIGVHAALGFRYVGVLAGVGNKFARWLDVVLMQRALGPGATTPAAPET